MNEFIIDVKQLKKSFGNNVVVKSLDIQVKKGEIYGFLGANGSGKTTSIRMICGLLTPDSGEGTCMGYSVVQESAEIKKRVGYMPQKFSLYQELSIRENLEFMGQLYATEHLEDKIDDILHALFLKSREHQLAGALSGGWKQRLSLAACLLHDPQVLLLDEPTAGIDPLARRDFWDLIHGLSLKGVTTLISTHYMDEAERCQRLAYLSDGAILVQGRVAEVIAATHLITFNLSGDLTADLLLALKNMAGVVQAAWFGRHFHICGYDEALLEKGLSQLRLDHTFEYGKIDSTLEDAFIALGHHQTLGDI
jgi:ABC-2 type transport system ATP-binding protein